MPSKPSSYAFGNTNPFASSSSTGPETNAPPQPRINTNLNSNNSESRMSSLNSSAANSRRPSDAALAPGGRNMIYSNSAGMNSVNSSGLNLSRQSSGDSLGSGDGFLHRTPVNQQRYNAFASPSPNASNPHLSPSGQPLYRSTNDGRSSPTPSSIDSHSNSPYAQQMNLPPGQHMSVNSKGGYGRGVQGQVGTAGFGGYGAGEKGWSAIKGNGSPKSLAPTISDKFSLSPDPASWGGNIGPNQSEPDDYLHNPDPKRDRKNDRGGTIFTARGIVNLGCLLLLVLGLCALFAGYPLISAYTTRKSSNLGAYNLGGINATGQVAATIGNFGLIDEDTPDSAFYHTSMEDGSQWELVFSDEFNKEGRTFWPGDDPFWEAEDLHYWGTNNLEWYDPRAIETSNGHLKITLSKDKNHNLNYTGGLMSTWNKFCFTGGYVETSVSLPGRNDVYGLWPAVWTLGNLGRAGYGGTLDGMWPYSYDSCDVGTLKNQTLNGLPEIARTSGANWSPYNGTLSYLPGQRLSACTCTNDPSHPGPKKADGSFRGRSAPEIDILEAQVSHQNLQGQVSQSLQTAPFNAFYQYTNRTGIDYDVINPNDPLNSYLGGSTQQALSATPYTNQGCYTGTGMVGCFSVYGFEYKPGTDGYVRWVNDGKQSWWVRASATGPDSQTQISARPVPYEPLYLIVNLGISENFGEVDYEGLEPLWPVHMLIDYIRVYQDPNNKNVGCSPPDMPTEQYIADYIEAYTNPNITTFDQQPNLKYPWPKNNLVDTC